MSMREIRSIIDDTLLGTVPLTEPADVPGIVATARTAQPLWAAAAPHQRAALLTAAADELAGRVDELAVLHARESGKILPQAHHEVLGAVNLLRRNADLGRLQSGEIAPTGSLPGGEQDLTLVERVPLGVVVAVVPFNFPVELTMEKAAAALATGNTVVVKLPPQNPLTSAAVLEVLARHLPVGVLQQVYADLPASAALAAADGVDAVSLTGSVGAGQAVAAATSASLRPLHLELGGNGAAIVRPDADLDHVVAECLRGRLLMNGQACAATKRVLVHVDVAEEFVARLVAALADIVPTDPLAEGARLGHLIDAGAAARVEQQVQHAISQGARRVLGSAPEGAFFAPTVLADVPAEADVMHDDEIFGPVWSVHTYTEDDAAVALANDTSLRLTAAVFTQDLPTAMAMASRLDFGGVVVNGTNNYRPPVVPFGGVALAGAGREGNGWTIDELTRTKFTAIRGIRPPGIAPVPTGA